MERHGRGKGKKRLLGSHQKCWLWGRNLILETLRSGRWDVLDLFLAASLEEDVLADCRHMADARGVPIRVEPPEYLERLCHTTEHQGFLARMAEFPYAAEKEMLESLPPASASVLLDGVQDPYNFGAILRSAEVFGMDGILIPAAGQVGVTSMVARSSAGAVNRIPIARVESLEATAGLLRARGVAVVAASEKGSVAIGEYDFRRGVAVIIGNEGRGVSPGLLGLCDAVLRIPQKGRIGSLNAAVAAGVFFYEVARQRGMGVGGGPAVS